MKSVLACSVLLAAACGGSDLDPGAGDHAGTGTSTLVVQGEVSARPRLANAKSPADYDTEFRVSVRLNGQNVTTGVVTVTSASGSVPLTFQSNGNGNDNEWVGSQAGYDEVYVMDVESGPDNVYDVRVDGPDIHTFGEPLAGANLDSTMMNTFKWSRDDRADTASFRAGELELAIEDTGSYQLAPGGLKAEKDKARENTIRLERTNRATPKGGAAGSELSVSVRNDITVVALPNPAL